MNNSESDDEKLFIGCPIMTMHDTSSHATVEENLRCIAGMIRLLAHGCPMRTNKPVVEVEYVVSDLEGILELLTTNRPDLTIEDAKNDLVDLIRSYRNKINESEAEDGME